MNRKISANITSPSIKKPHQTRNMSKKPLTDKQQLKIATNKQHLPALKPETSEIQEICDKIDECFNNISNLLKSDEVSYSVAKEYYPNLLEITETQNNKNLNQTNFKDSP